jgi:hypothetical protein
MLWLHCDGVVTDIVGSLRSAGCSCANGRLLCGGSLEGDSSWAWIGCPSCGKMVMINLSNSSRTVCAEVEL